MMNDTFIFRLMIVVIAIVIIFALVAQYNKSKTHQETQYPGPAPARAQGPSAAAHHEGFEAPLLTPQAKSPVGGDVKYKNPAPAQAAPSRTAVAPPPAPSHLLKADPAPFESLDTEMYRTMDYKPEASNKPQADPYPRDRLTKDDLLPKDAANSKWAQVNPSGQGDLENVNLLDAGWNFGIDTQGQTLKNPNLQLRSEFPNPREDTGPWQQSTIENDCSRRYFEIGQP